jgi:hypothetical protein
VRETIAVSAETNHNDQGMNGQRVAQDHLLLSPCKGRRDSHLISIMAGS